MSNLTNTSPLVLPQNINGSLVNPYKPEVRAKVVNYCLYARKSSEDDERQALSIDSQIKEMTIVAQSEDLNVTDIRRESHSAKNSSARPVFNQMIQDIRKGVFQGILTWAPDRLSRNAGDLGSIVDLMDSGYLKEIRAHGQALTNSPNDKFLLMILCSQAKLENDNRGINVKRGMKTKCELGYRPNQAPLGYLNDYYSGKGQKQVFTDKERAPFIKQAFEKVAYEGFSGRNLYDWFKNETTFRSKSGKVYTLSMIYRMLNNLYYCGIFEYSGKWYPGSHEAIISRELFELVQKKMMIPRKSKPGTKEFAFTKLLKCGACGSGITAQEKFKRYKSGELKRYVYYHCSQFKDFDCREPYIREEKLTEQLINLLQKVSIEEIETKATLKPELDKFMVIKTAMNNLNNATSVIKTDVDITDFINYIFQKGSRTQKHELINCLNTTLYLENRTISIKE